MKPAVICAVILCAFVIGFSRASPVIDNESGGHIENSVHPLEYTSAEETLLRKIKSKCASNDLNSCVTLKAINYMNLLVKKSLIQFGDVEIMKTSDVEILTEGQSRSLNENEPEEKQLLQLFSDKAWQFISSRSLKWKAVDDAELVLSTNTDKEGAFNFGLSVRPTKSEGGEARKKDKNGMGAIMAAAVLKIGLLKALAFKAIALLVGKALLVSKLALVLALVIGLKKLFSHEKHVTYEVVAHPHHETHHEHSISNSGPHQESYSGWGRNLDAANLAYRAHVPVNSL